ncbi:MAG: YdcF family protein [Candidatus Aenigmarchaeota archaeon]|nr:YdcF family protein [Candidatus Aenigmarchaeota archaeon]
MSFDLYSVLYAEDVAIIVCGAGVDDKGLPLPMGRVRADEAYEIFKYLEGQGRRADIIVSGGRENFTTGVTEARALKNYLERKGIDPSYLHPEENSFDLLTNEFYSEELARNELGSPEGRYIIISKLMIPRTSVVSKYVIGKQGEPFRWSVVGVNDPYYSGLKAGLREKFWSVVYKLLLLGSYPGDLESLRPRIRLWEMTAGEMRKLLS